MKRLLARLLPGSIAGRTILVLLFGLTFSHLASMWTYHEDLLRELGLSSERQLAERIVSIRRVVADAPENERDRVAHSASIQGLEVHWSRIPAVEATSDPGPRVTELRRRLEELVPDLAGDRLRSGYSDAGLPGDRHEPRHALHIAAALPDGSWVNFGLLNLADRPSGSAHLVLSTSLMALAILVLSVLSVRVLTAPLRSLARAAERLGVDVMMPPLPETGPREIRYAARAFNEMQSRIRKLVTDRTQMLAAVSHDLRTPITRLRLRADFVDDDEQRAKMLSDLDEMESMISATLAFLRDEAAGEEPKVADLAALLQTVCDDMADAGHDVHFERKAADAALRCRPLALKRAFTNVIENAVKYGGKALVTLDSEQAGFLVDVEDDGPGIPEKERERVFSPFYRIEGSRSRQTGGTGLGLAVARSVIRAHGGEIELENRDSGGLRVIVKLPRMTTV